ncbi:MAG: DUF4112 domain-containing protein [Verrucomicrobia bacterium]|nr:DUF4112 domain-containing protein [Verrucomicrobiota bacterium]
MPKESKPDYLDFEVLPKTGSRVRNSPETTTDPVIWLVSRVLDTIFRIPGTRIRFGLEPVIGLIPVLGDQVTTLISAALLFRSLQHRLPKIALVRMGLNIAINGLIGMIPLIGDLFVLWYKPNIRNYRILQRHVGQAGKSSRADWFFVLAIVGVTFLLTTLFGAFIGYAVIRALQSPF